MQLQQTGWLASRFASLSTGLKMFLILSLGLFPLGLIAILASVQSARDNIAKREDQTLARLDVKAQRIDSLLSRSEDTIRAASAAISLTEPGSGVCVGTLERLARAETIRGRYALYGEDGRLRCATGRFAAPATLPAGNRESVVEITPGGEHLRFALYDDRGVIEGLGEYDRNGLSDLTLIPGTAADFDLELVQGARRMVLRRDYAPGPMVQTVSAGRPVAGGQLRLDIVLGAAPVSAPEILMILLPVLMWIWAAIIGWILVNRLILRPLGRMQRAVSAYQPGDRHLDLPTLATPAREIGELGRAFDRVTQTVARHEAELEAGIERQKKLVREVHHRVKNNLQVVASLLNLHARGSTNEEVGAAYASIQRRVDALAVVHRNHYAELEDNRGVALKPLLSELGANLRATAPASAAGMQIRLAVEPYHVTQDVAVSVAFLVTEIVEFAMFCGARAVAISLVGRDGGTARLAVESDSLGAGAACDEALTERFNRIVTGLSRQLRSAVERDEEAGSYALEIAVIDRAAA